MKKLLLLMLVFVTIISLSACGGANEDNQLEVENPPTVVEEEPQNVDDIELEEDNLDDLEEASGIYVGQIDNNTIEIMVEDNPMVFVITEVQDDIDNLDENDQVIVRYVGNEYGQLILESIEKVD